MYCTRRSSTGALHVGNKNNVCNAGSREVIKEGLRGVGRTLSVRVVLFFTSTVLTFDSSCNFSERYTLAVVQGLYCKRQIHCLASSEIDPPPLTAWRVCTPPPLVRGEDTLARRRGGGVSIVQRTPDTALYFIYVRTLWFLSSTLHIPFPKGTLSDWWNGFMFTPQIIKKREGGRKRTKTWKFYEPGGLKYTNYPYILQFWLILLLWLETSGYLSKFPSDYFLIKSNDFSK